MFMKRHLQRRKAMECMYQHLLLKKNIKEILLDNGVTGLSAEEIFVTEIVQDANLNKNVYISEINDKLSDWEFVRLGFIEQSILLVALSEFHLGHVERAIIINEAIELAKEFGDEDAYKLINGVLDQL